jgi:hypothetical protein
MSRFSLLILALLAVILAPLPVALGADDGAHPANASCLACCDNTADHCQAKVAGCERICAAAVLPALLQIAQPSMGGLPGQPRAQSQFSFSNKPIPPPPRGEAPAI